MFWQSAEKPLVFKDNTVPKCLVVSSQATTLKHKVKQWLLTRKGLISAALQNKLTAGFSLLAAAYLCVSVVIWEDTIKHKNERLLYFLMDCLSAHAKRGRGKGSGL